MAWIKKNWSNILFFILLGLLLFPQTRMPIQVFAQRLLSFSPSEIVVEKRATLQDYHWKLNSLEGNQLNLATSKGNVILINFWATWCPPCVAEMPSLQRLYNDYGDNVDFYFVSTEEKEVLKKFMSKNDYTFPILQYNSVSESLDISALPTTLLIDKKGTIVMREEGAAKWDAVSVKETINRLLKE